MTHVSIKDASSQTYPEITFCRPLGNPDYKNTLKECNLTVEDYFDWYTWVGNGSDFCKDPKKLYEKLSQNLSLILPEMHVYGFNAFQVERFIPTDDNLVIKELPSVGRCLAYQIPEDKEVWEVKIQMENFDELRLSLCKQHRKRFHLVVGGLVGAAVVLLCKIVDGQYKDGN